MFIACLRLTLTRFYRGGIITGFPDHTELRLGDGVDGLFVDGVPELVKGSQKEWAERAQVDSVGIPGYWMHKNYGRDSAGGNIALALTRYLVENRTTYPELPEAPRALLLLSPWADLCRSNSGPGSSARVRQGTDYLVPKKTVSDDGVPQAFVSPHGLRFSWKSRYVSPACKELEVSFSGFPKTFIAVGDAELLLHSTQVLQQRMTKDLGTEVVIYYEVKDSVMISSFSNGKSPSEPRR